MYRLLTYISRTENPSRTLRQITSQKSSINASAIVPDDEIVAYGIALGYVRAHAIRIFMFMQWGLYNALPKDYRED